MRNYAKFTFEIISNLLLFIFLFISPGFPAYAAESEGNMQVSSYWDPVGEQTEYVSEYTPVTGETQNWSGGFYVVRENVTISERVTLAENTKLLLEDDAVLRLEHGIDLNGKNLEIYAQEKGTGKLNVYANGAEAAISGAGSQLAIYGGRILADGRELANGICLTGFNTNMTIYKGTLSACGGSGKAGIELGANLFNINGGIVYARGGGSEPGIRANYYTPNPAPNPDDSELVPEEPIVVPVIFSSQGIVGTHITGSKHGIFFNTDTKTGEILGEAVLPNESFTIPSGYTLSASENTWLTIPEGITVVNKGSIVAGRVFHDRVEGIHIINEGKFVDLGFIETDEVEIAYDYDIPVRAIDLLEEDLELYTGETGRLDAIVTPSSANTPLVWASSDETVATVSGGCIQAISPGKAVITVSANGLSASCTVEVSKRVIPVESVSLDRTALSMEVDETVTLTSTVSPADATDRTVDWSVADPEIVSVQDGQVTAHKEGSTVVTASAGGKSASCTVTVSAPSSDIPVESVVLSETSLTVEVGETVQLTAKVYPENATDQTLTWSVDHQQVAEVEDGWVTGLYAENTKVHVFAGGEEAVCRVTVVKPKPVLPEEKPDEEEEDTGGQPEKEDGNQAEEIPSDSSDLPSVPELPEGDGNFDGSMDFFRPASVPDGWKDSGGGTVYYRGGVRATGWQEVGGETYFFDEKGLLQTGWIEQPEGWYYAGETGAQRLGWQKVGNAWYYLDAETGRMLDGGLAEIDGETYYFYDWGGMANSWWMETEEGWYFFDGSGAMKKSGWVLWKGKYYYLTDSGKMAVDTRTPDGYYVDAEGVWIA